MTATFMPADVDSTTNPVEGNEGDIVRAPFIPYLSRLVQRTTRQWSECVVETCIAKKARKCLCSKKVRVLHNSNPKT